jgi:hypothetical protein
MDEYGPQKAFPAQPPAGLSGSSWTESLLAQGADRNSFPANVPAASLPPTDEQGDLRSAQAGPDGIPPVRPRRPRRRES